MLKARRRHREVIGDMKPGPKDVKLAILITGDELHELKRFTVDMAEAFRAGSGNLDRSISGFSA
jgi:hypothetical protein